MLMSMSWLRPAPKDFRDQLRGLQKEVRGERGEDLGLRMCALANHALDENQLVSLARLAAETIKSCVSLQPLTALKLGVFGDGTLSLLAPAIAGTALRHRLMVETYVGEFNRALIDALDPSSLVRTAGLDMALIVSDARVLGLDQPAASREAAREKVEQAFLRLRQTVEGLRPSISSAVLVQTVAAPVEPLFGSFDRIEPGSPLSMIAAFNERVADWAEDGSIILVDVARLAECVGLETWDDPAHWHASKLGFAPTLLPVYADVVARTMAAVRGLSRKCLVLDLDNTLWGGVIGDDGLSGIVLGQGSPTGEAYLAIQRMALALRARGVVLAVCSKNEEANARAPFREHPDMLLREDHIAVFQANWTDKAANLRAIARTLNIGIDALVFLDDNPAERMQVRRELPLVAVPELPDDPALYPRTLAAAGYFEAVSFSKEDRERADMYQANAERAASLTASGDIGAYLASLDMVCTINFVDDVAKARVAQLINKSNQFNLATRRYSESELTAAIKDPARHVVQVRLADRFGDNGIIAVLIADKKVEAWEIDTWLMSCRVLGRRVEEACLAHLASAARLAGARALIGKYIPSAKNGMVKDLYQKLGLSLESESDGTTTWRLDLEAFIAPTLEMTVEDKALAKEDIAA
jgi:FkbH-like protein